MRKVIQHKETWLFLDATGNWIQQPDRAATFGSLTEAVNFCLERGIKRDVQLVLLMGNLSFPIDVFPSD